jgi:hypothetical protein
MEMMRELNDYFDTKIELPLIRYGKRQRIETLINEEALLLAKFIRDEKKEWIPRSPGLRYYCLRHAHLGMLTS